MNPETNKVTEWKQQLTAWNKKRGDHAGTALVVRHKEHFHVSVFDVLTGHTRLVVPEGEIEAVIGALVRIGIGMVSVPVTVPPFPRGPNPPPPPGMPVLRAAIRAIERVQTEILTEGIAAAIDVQLAEKLGSGGALGGGGGGF